jgi:hypothetical protein
MDGKRIIAYAALGVLVLAGLVPAPVVAATIQVAQGTEVKIVFAPEMKVISATLAKDIPLLITLAEPIVVGGKTIVEQGATGTAKVLEVEKASRGGKPGYIKVGFVELEPKGAYQSPEGAKIKLAGAVEHKGKGKKLLSYLFIAGLFIKGGEGAIPTGQTFTATVAESIILEAK